MTDWRLTDEEINKVANAEGFSPDYEEYLSAERAIVLADAHTVKRWIGGSLNEMLREEAHNE